MNDNFSSLGDLFRNSIIFEETENFMKLKNNSLTLFEEIPNSLKHGIKDIVLYQEYKKVVVIATAGIGGYKARFLEQEIRKICNRNNIEIISYEVNIERG